MSTTASLTAHPAWRWPEHPVEVIHTDHGPGMLTKWGNFYGYGLRNPFEPDARASCEPDWSHPATRAACWAANGPDLPNSAPRFVPGSDSIRETLRGYLDVRHKEGSR